MIILWLKQFWSGAKATIIMVALGAVAVLGAYLKAKNDGKREAKAEVTKHQQKVLVKQLKDSNEDRKATSNLTDDQRASELSDLYRD